MHTKKNKLYLIKIFNMAFFYISFSQNVSIIKVFLNVNFKFLFMYFFVHFIKAQTVKHDARNTNTTGLIPAKFT